MKEFLSLPKPWLEPAVRIWPDTRGKVWKSPEISTGEQEPVPRDGEVCGGEHQAPDGVEHSDGPRVDIQHAGLVIRHEWGQRLLCEDSLGIMGNIIKVRMIVNVVTGYWGHWIGVICRSQGSCSKRIGADSSCSQIVPDEVTGAVILRETVCQTLRIKVDGEATGGAAVPLTILLPACDDPATWVIL